MIVRTKAKRNKHREWLLKQYGIFYHKVEYFDVTECAYCGYLQQCWDHAPAISLLSKLDKDVRENWPRFLLYPSCNKCNSLLGNKPLLSYHSRLEYLLKRYYPGDCEEDYIHNGEVIFEESYHFDKEGSKHHNEDEYTGTLLIYIRYFQNERRIYLSKAKNIHQNIKRVLKGDLDESWF